MDGRGLRVAVIGEVVNAGRQHVAIAEFHANRIGTAAQFGAACQAAVQQQRSDGKGDASTTMIEAVQRVVWFHVHYLLKLSFVNVFRGTMARSEERRVGKECR